MTMPAKRISSRPTLQSLLHGMADAPPIPITDIATDSRQLNTGSVFLACQGSQSHGIDFLQDASDADVAAIVFDSSTAEQPAFETRVPVIGVPHLQDHIGSIVDRWFDSPSVDIAVTGITGTNGKTTVALMLAQCLQMLNRRCAYVGTLGHGIDEIEYAGGLTTPSCIDLHRLMADFRDQQATHAAIEVSSHSLKQQRVAGIRFDTAVFTNLSRDHIDYHGSIRAYFEAKALLFSKYEPKHSVINVDSEFGAALADRCGRDAVTVSARNRRKFSSRYVSVGAVNANADRKSVV